MALSVRRLSVYYGQSAAVSEANLEIADGSVWALLGPSGAGKSTLLRAIAGLEPYRGTVMWDGFWLETVPVHQRGFGLVFQDGQLFQHRDVAGNVEFGMRMRGVGRPPRVARVAELLELVGLRGYQRRRVSELSGGEAQRVALARALAPWPRLLLLDEPLSGLDAELREQLAMDLAELLRAAKVSTLLVTHDQEEAFSLADNVAILRDGKICQTGAVTDVWRRPADPETARFLGVTTIVPGTIHGGVLRCVFGELPLSGEPDGSVRVGLRPAGLRAAESGRGGEVIQAMYRRDRLRLRVRLADPAEVSVVDAQASLSADIHPGDQVQLAINPDGIALLPPE